MYCLSEAEAEPCSCSFMGKETQDDIAKPSACNDIGTYRTLPLANDANMPMKHRMAKIMNDVLTLSKKSG